MTIPRIVPYALTLAAAVCSAPASAQIFSSGWVVPDGENCGATQSFEGKGSTELVLIVNDDGTAGIQLTNYGWSAKEGEVYPIQVYLGSKAYDAKGHGTTDNVFRHGFFFSVGPDFLADFRAAAGMRIYRDTALVDDLSLSGSAEAMRAIDNCLTAKRAEAAAAERERRRFAHIADDPFSPPAASATPPAVSKPGGKTDTWIRPDDYPTQARRDGWTGDVGYELQVEPDGSVVSCFVRSSSGYPLLDDLTCKLLVRRAVFEQDPTAKANREIQGVQHWQP